MEARKHFENRERNLSNGVTAFIPVYVGEGAETPPEAEDLLRVAGIVASTFDKEEFLTLGELVDWIREMRIDPTREGILIEDEERGESVAITADRTVLTVVGVGRSELRTTLVFDMLYAWFSDNSPKS